jgi:hypothetical protein
MRWAFSRIDSSALPFPNIVECRFSRRAALTRSEAICNHHARMISSIAPLRFFVAISASLQCENHGHPRWVENPFEVVVFAKRVQLFVHGRLRPVSPNSEGEVHQWVWVEECPF